MSIQGLRSLFLASVCLALAPAGAAFAASTDKVLNEVVTGEWRSADDKGRDAALAKLHARIVEEAPFIWIAHDVGPRAMSTKVKGVVQPKSWFIDIATMSMD